MSEKKQDTLPPEHFRAANIRQPEDYIKTGQPGIPDDPFLRPAGNPFLPPVCNKCGKPAPNGQSLNRYSTCKACEALLKAGKIK